MSYYRYSTRLKLNGIQLMRNVLYNMISNKKTIIIIIHLMLFLQLNYFIGKFMYIFLVYLIFTYLKNKNKILL